MALKILSISKQASSEIVELLSNNIIGTPNHGMLYQHLNVASKIDSIQEPFFVTLTKGNQTIGTCCFCRRTTFNSQEAFEDSFYIRYFSLKPSFRVTYADNKDRKKEGVIKQDIERILNSHDLATSRLSGPRLFYAYVDPDNVRSAQLCKDLGFERVRRFETIIFSRVKLKDNRGDGISKLAVREQQEMAALLLQLYNSHNFISLENLFNGKDYYVIRDNNGIVLAGAQANPDHWKIHRMRTRKMDVAVRLSSGIPYLNRIVSKNFKFLAIDGLYYKEGHERLIVTLLEGLLARHNLHNAFIPVDCDCDTYRHLIKFDLGLTNRLTKRVKTDVICKLNNFPQEEINRFRSRPAYVSAIDIT